MSSMRNLVVVVALLAASGLAMAQSMAGEYQGRYKCSVWRDVKLQVHDQGHGIISATFDFSLDDGRNGRGLYLLMGQYDERTGRFQLTPQRWLRQPPGFVMIGLQGVYDAKSGRLRGHLSGPNCGEFEIASTGGRRPGRPPAVASPGGPGTMSQSSAANSQPYRGGFVPPERRNRVTLLTNEMPEHLEYWDAAMEGPGGPREADPMDDVIDWLKGQDFSCLGTQRVTWNRDGTQGSAQGRVTVRERYVIECDGDCRGLYYLPYVQATVWHFGTTQPVPVMEFKSTWFGGTNFQWKFTRDAAGAPPPEVYIHRFSAGKFLSGQDCHSPKTKNR